MLTLVKPKYFMPIHGEYRMQRVHGDLAIQTGVDPKNVFVLENGDVLAINERTARVAGHVPASEVYVDGSGIGDVSGNIIKERKMLADDGMFSLIITIDSKKKTVHLDPQVVSRGFIFMKDSEELTKYFVDKAKEYLLGELENMKMVNLLQLKKGLTEELSNIIYKKTDRKPMVIPVFMDIAGK
jgi:ribonuclease J